MASSPTGGVKPMAIAGRMVRERERLAGMSAEERSWRAQWLKDQHLAPNEPVAVPEYKRALENPIRRIYKAPLDGLYKALCPILGHRRSFAVRYWTGKFFISAAAIYAGAYYFKYNQNDWTRKGGWRVIKSRTASYPGDPDYPRGSDRTKPADYAARGFKEAAI